ncbi:hypothetical protein [Bacteroides caccae]|uniref:hypothetical protein n=1 Tax=Bacteroides caccae TaxID=47678 RepID=UPI001E361129|nr:hypothetical protein [Bacteroides caccae]
MPCQSFQSMVSYLPGAGKRSLPESRKRPFPEARRYVREKYMGGRSAFGCRTNTGELFRAGRCPASAMQPAGVVGSGRRDGTARAPRFKRKTVKALSPTLGIAGESPTRRGTLRQSSGNTN